MANMTSSIDPKFVPSLKFAFARLQPEPEAISAAFKRLSQQNVLTPILKESLLKLNGVSNPSVSDIRVTARRATELLLKTPNGMPNIDVGKQSAQLGPLIAGGAKTRVILRAIAQLEKEGQLPDGLTAKERNNKLMARIVANGGSVANSEAAMARAIQRAYRRRGH